MNPSQDAEAGAGYNIMAGRRHHMGGIIMHRKITPFVLLTAILTGCGSNRDDAHPKDHQKPGEKDHPGHSGGQATLMVKTNPTPVEARKAATLNLMIHDAGGAVVKNFDIVHEEKVHLIIVRDGLDQFAHIHPAVDAAGNLAVTFTFPTGGTYRLYADHQPAGGKQATATAELKVTGEAPPAPTLTPDVPGKVKGDGLNAQVTIDNATAGGEATVRFELTDAAGKPVTDLQPYMGAMGHLVVLSSDGKQYVHAHPADDKPAKGNMVAFQAHFTKAGLYKGWGQFRWQQEVRVIPIVVKVD